MGDTTAAQADLLGSLIEEKDFTAALVEAQHQMLRRFGRVEFSESGKKIALDIVQRAETDLDAMLAGRTTAGEIHAIREAQHRDILRIREQALSPQTALSWQERGSILEMLGSLERAFTLAERIHEERQSVSRTLTNLQRPQEIDRGPFDAAQTVPA